MTDKAALENQISTVKKYLHMIERYHAFSQEHIANNIDIRGAVERYLYLLAQSAIDLGESVIAYRRLRKPGTMSEIFHILREEGIIDEELLGRMTAMTGFRNVIAHDYEEVDYGIVYHILHEGVEDIRRYVRVIEALIA